MHGLINRAIQCFLRDTYSPEFWERIMQTADLGYTSFEAMLVYEDQVTFDILDLATQALDKARPDLLEDLGTYLVSHDSVEALRRLLRFGGVDFVDFLHSLDDLPDRARLAVPDLELPRLELQQSHEAHYSLWCGGPAGFGSVMVGVLRAMADDYGALVFLEHGGSREAKSTPGGPVPASEVGPEVVEITLLDVEFHEGRHFELAMKAG